MAAHRQTNRESIIVLVSILEVQIDTAVYLCFFSHGRQFLPRLCHGTIRDRRTISYRACTRDSRRGCVKQPFRLLNAICTPDTKRNERPYARFYARWRTALKGTVELFNRGSSARFGALQIRRSSRTLFGKSISVGRVFLTYGIFQSRGAKILKRYQSDWFKTLFVQAFFLLFQTSRTSSLPFFHLKYLRICKLFSFQGEVKILFFNFRAKLGRLCEIQKFDFIFLNDERRVMILSVEIISRNKIQPDFESF